MEDPRTGHSKYIENNASKERESAMKRATALTLEEQHTRNKRKDAINLAHSRSTNRNNTARIINTPYSLRITDAGHDDAISAMSSDSNYPPPPVLRRHDDHESFDQMAFASFHGDAAGAAAQKVELSTSQPVPLQQYIGHHHSTAFMSDKKEKKLSKGKDAINLAHSRSNNRNNTARVINTPYSLTITEAGHDDAISAMSSDSNYPPPPVLRRHDDHESFDQMAFASFHGDAAGAAAQKVELSTSQPVPLQQYVGHPRLDALLSSF